MQKALSKEQIEAFYHDAFVEDQVRDFINVTDCRLEAGCVVVDVGGGCGFFARRLMQLTSCHVKVVDKDPTSIEKCKECGVEGYCGDALDPNVTMGDVACFNLILHHLVGDSEQVTTALQRKALAAWRAHVYCVFVNEYIYESYFGNVSGWLIFHITKSRILSWIGRKVATVIPSFRANTFGVGVRFRAHDEWKKLFASAGYVVKSTVIGRPEQISAPLRLLMIKNIRRDSFLLEPVAGQRVAVDL